MLGQFFPRCRPQEKGWRSTHWMAATDRSRARYADLAERRAAGLVGREERGGAYRLVSQSFGRGRGEYWRQVSSRYYGNFERAGSQVAHDVVKIAAVVHPLDPAWIDGNRPCHRQEDDHQGHQKPDQSSRTLHRGRYPYLPVLGRVNSHRALPLAAQRASSAFLWSNSGVAD